MKAKEIKRGGVYLAKVSGKLVRVRVDNIREISRFKRSNYSGQAEYTDKTIWDVTNLTTGRKTTFKSAQKFWGEAKAVSELEGRLKKLAERGAAGTITAEEQDRRHNEILRDEAASRRPRTIADVNRDQGREMEDALGPIGDEDYQSQDRTKREHVKPSVTYLAPKPSLPMRELIIGRLKNLRVWGVMRSIEHTNEQWLDYLNDLDDEDLLDKYLELRDLQNCNG